MALTAISYRYTHFRSGPFTSSLPLVPLLSNLILTVPIDITPLAIVVLQLFVVVLVAEAIQMQL